MSDIIVTEAEVQSAIIACRITGWKGVAERLERGWRPERDTSEAELLELFARHAAQARLEALEEAAKFCEQHGETAGAHGPALATRTAIASGIRNLEVPE